MLIYLSGNLLEIPRVTKYATLKNILNIMKYVDCNQDLCLFSFFRCLNKEEQDEVVRLRTQGNQHLCSLRKENLTSWSDSETQCARHIFTLDGSEDSGHWHPVTELPFRADKWCFTTVVLYNYLYVIGGYRQRVKKGWDFKMASFRYNPINRTWADIAPLIKVRQRSA